MSHPRLPYDDVVLACPVTIAYERFSEHSAHYWLGSALRRLLDDSGLQKLRWMVFVYPASPWEMTRL